MRAPSGAGAAAAPPGVVREARHVRVRDGTRLAAYVFRPATRARLPAVWTHNRYYATGLSPGQRAAWLERFPGLANVPGAHADTLRLAKRAIADVPWLQRLLEGGFAVAIVDARGVGASFGTQSLPFEPQEASDANDVTRWLAGQPWCTGSVGMFGRSYMGANQHVAAASAPACLRAIFPEMAVHDLYAFVRSGGVFRDAFAREWAQAVAPPAGGEVVLPVDGDRDGSLLREAREEHRGNRDLLELFAALPFRDSLDARTGLRPYLDCNPGFDADGPRRADVPVYLLAGWFDPFVRDAAVWFANTQAPKRLVIGPWAHEGSAGIDLAEEHRRWYDRWLRGAEGGAEDPPVAYYTLRAPAGRRWRLAERWPPPEARPLTLHLAAGPSGSVRSANDGGLAPGAPSAEDACDRYRVDYATTSGIATRWSNACGGPFGYPDMSANDERALTYTTSALERDLEVTGHPVVHLWVSSSAADGDFFAYLEDVGPDGSSRYVTEGVLRASHRALGRPPLDLLGLPYHPSRERDACALPREPVELVLDLLPTSYLFAASRRVRLTVACADRDNALTPRLSPPPEVRVHRGARRPSRIVLPVVAA